jgi:hypothetical protein
MLGIIGIVVAVIAAVLAAFAVIYQRRSVPPKLELSVETAITPVLPSGSAMLGRITMAYEDGSPLTDPHIVQIDLHNMGSAAIGKELYDGDPYVVRFGTKVIDKVDETNNLPDRTTPDTRVSDSELWIGPGTIHQGQKLTYSVLIDGRAEIDLICPIKNVTLVDLEKREASAERRSKVMGILAATLMAVAFAIVAVTYINSRPTEHLNCRPDNGELVCTAPTPPVTVTVTQTPRTTKR